VADFDSASADRGTLLSLERESVTGIRALILEKIDRLAANDFDFLEGIRRKEDNTMDLFVPLKGVVNRTFYTYL
jgi:hypothetical protein